MPSPSRTPPPDLQSAFEARFGRRPQVAARAPGRVNLIGEHTDYNAGLVLPCAVDRDTWVLAAPRSDERVRALSRELPVEGDFAASDPLRRGDWTDYLRGVWRSLALDRGADLAVASEVPLESGLSSSAALCVAATTALDACFELGLSARERGLVAHRAESEFVGVGCGVMDPLASALGTRDGALRIDCRDLAVEHIALPAGAMGLLLVHSGVRRRLREGGYAARRRECGQALAGAREAGLLAPDASALRDLSEADLGPLEAVLEPLPFRRARHVIRENQRVDAMARALAAGDLVAAGAVLREGMASLQNDFEVSCPELDALCEIGDGLPGVYGSRLTGAGFGGCSLHFTSPERLSAAAEELALAFASRFGHMPTWWSVVPEAGAEAVDLPS